MEVVKLVITEITPSEPDEAEHTAKHQGSTHQWYEG